VARIPFHGYGDANPEVRGRRVSNFRQRRRATARNEGGVDGCVTRAFFPNVCPEPEVDAGPTYWQLYNIWYV